MVGTKKDHVYGLIKHAIIAGDLEAGDIFSIDELSQRFKSGKTPVREALIVLTQEGLVDPIPRSGYMVAPITIRDVLEIFHLRTVLEVEAIGLAVDRITEDQLAGLRDSLDQEAALSQAARGSETGQRAYELNREFHLSIAQASGNSRLVRLIGQHLDEMERILARDPYIIEPRDHVGIIETLEKRDKAAAQTAMRQHLEETKARLMDRF
jgi:DNA-binding GntR family transcriptional regulator